MGGMGNEGEGDGNNNSSPAHNTTTKTITALSTHAGSSISRLPSRRRTAEEEEGSAESEW